jgi:hypothetical protein
MFPNQERQQRYLIWAILDILSFSGLIYWSCKFYCRKIEVHLFFVHSLNRNLIRPGFMGFTALA